MDWTLNGKVINHQIPVKLVVVFALMLRNMVFVLIPINQILPEECMTGAIFTESS
jgi:hypothetical protein